MFTEEPIGGEKVKRLPKPKFIVVFDNVSFHRLKDAKGFLKNAEDVLQLKGEVRLKQYTNCFQCPNICRGELYFDVCPLGALFIHPEEKFNILLRVLKTRDFDVTEPWIREFYEFVRKYYLRR